MAHTSHEAAESLYLAMPHAMPLETLSEYGLEVSPMQARHITQEILSLSLYWIQTAVHSTLRAAEAEHVMTALAQRIQLGWKDFDLEGQDQAAVLEDAANRRAGYNQIVQEGGSPIAVFGESAGALEFSGASEAGDRQKLLALFIDMIPVDTFGELVAGFELADP